VTDKKTRKTELPLRLEMSFGEALSRFAATKPEEIETSIARSKAKKPPQDGSPRRPGRPRRQALKRP
jgi:hypothetical protein